MFLLAYSKNEMIDWYHHEGHLFGFIFSLSDCFGVLIKREDLK